MTFEHYVIIALSVLLVGQQVFWLINVQKLVDKAMSGSYSEYVQSEMVKSNTSARNNEQKETKEIIDDFSVEQANRANGMFGFS